MSEVYIDTSILGAYYCPEPFSMQCEAYLRKVEAPVISLLTEVEFFSLVTKKRRIGDFGTSKARKILMEFQSHMKSGFFRIVSPSFDHFMTARQMIGSMQTSLRTLDAIHLSIAKSEKIGMVTADGILFESARRFKLKVDYIRRDE